MSSIALVFKYQFQNVLLIDDSVSPRPAWFLFQKYVHKDAVTKHTEDGIREGVWHKTRPIERQRKLFRIHLSKQQVMTCTYESCSEISYESHQKAVMTSLGKFWENKLLKVPIPTS